MLKWKDANLSVATAVSFFLHKLHETLLQRWPKMWADARDADAIQVAARPHSVFQHY